MAAPEPQPAADPQPLVATDTPRVAGPKGRQPGRIGKSPVPAHLPEAAYRQLRRLGIDQGKTVQRWPRKPSMIISPSTVCQRSPGRPAAS